MAEFQITEKQKAAFFKKQFQAPSGCIEWTGSKNLDGYGTFWAAGQVRGAHRVAYTIAFGQVGNGLHVLHRCDNPSCVNPDHLFAGNQSDNMRDMHNKGRKTMPIKFIESAKRDKSGEKNPHATLSILDVRQIRASEDSNKELSVRFCVTTQNIRLIRLNKTWRV